MGILMANRRGKWRANGQFRRARKGEHTVIWNKVMEGSDTSFIHFCQILREK